MRTTYSDFSTNYISKTSEKITQAVLGRPSLQLKLESDLNYEYIQAMLGNPNTWSLSTTYSAGQIVKYNNNVYISQQDNNSNQVPDASNSSYWTYSFPLTYVGNTIFMVVGNVSSPLLDLPLKNSLIMRSGVGSATFTRASTATYINRYKVLQVAGVNTPRFEKQGYLCEGTSTNLLLYSEQAGNSAWTQNNVTVSANTTSTTDPYGTNLADKIVEDKSNNIHCIYQTVSVQSAILTFSCFVKAAESTKFRLNSYESSTPSNPIIADFDLSAVTATPANSSTISATITPLANGWFRVSATTTSAAKVSTNFYLQTTRSGTGAYTGDGSSGLYVFGAQLEALPFATSYIPTVGSNVTRAADNLIIDSIGNSNGITDRFSEETLIFDFATLGGSQDYSGYPFKFDGDNTAYRAFYNTKNANMTLQYGSDSVSGSQLSISNSSLSTMTRYALSHDASGTTKAYMNGSLKTTGNSGNGNITSPCSVIYIGSGAYGHITNFRIYDRVLTPYEVSLT
jgi:hypothetical protein